MLQYDPEPNRLQVDVVYCAIKVESLRFLYIPFQKRTLRTSFKFYCNFSFLKSIIILLIQLVLTSTESLVFSWFKCVAPAWAIWWTCKGPIDQWWTTTVVNLFSASLRGVGLSCICLRILGSGIFRFPYDVFVHSFKARRYIFRVEKSIDWLTGIWTLNLRIDNL